MQTRYKFPAKELILIMNFTGIILVLFAGLRYDNPDYSNYVEIYNGIIKNEKGESSPDIGFNAICRLLSLISRNPVIMFLTIAFLSITINFKAIKQYTPYVFICILLYFVHNYVLKDMIQIRAGLASALCLYSLRYLPKEKYKNAILFWVLALSVHFTSILFGVVYLIHKLKLSKRVLFTCLVLSLIIGTIYPLGQLIKIVTGLDAYSNRAALYVAYGDEGYASALGIWTNINTVKSLFIALFLFFYYDRLNKWKYFYPLCVSYVVGLCWLICFNDFSIVASRMSNILLSVEPILLTYFYILFKPNSRLGYTILLIGYSILLFRFNIAPNKIIDYQSVLFKLPL